MAVLLLGLAGKVCNCALCKCNVPEIWLREPLQIDVVI